MYTHTRTPIHLDTHIIILCVVCTPVYPYICTHVHPYTCTLNCTPKHLYTCTVVHPCTPIHLYIHICVLLCTCTPMHLYTYVRVHLNTWALICLTSIHFSFLYMHHFSDDGDPWLRQRNNHKIGILDISQNIYNFVLISLT